MQIWGRLRVVVKAAAAAIAEEPKELASIQPTIDQVLEFVKSTPSADILDDMEYLLQRVEKFVAPWRRSPGSPFYVPPSWAANTDNEVLEALRLLQQLRATGLPAAPAAHEGAKKVGAVPGRTGRPSMFIGSSGEGHVIAENLQLGLDHTVECTIWSQGVFGLSLGTLENLVAATRSFDFAVLVLTPDDLVHKRGATGSIPRDNVVFELGLFMGALGRERTFMVYCRDEKLDLPSDLAGITSATYAKRIDGNLRGALGPVCTLLKEAISKAAANHS